MISRVASRVPAADVPVPLRWWSAWVFGGLAVVTLVLVAVCAGAMLHGWLRSGR